MSRHAASIYLAGALAIGAKLWGNHYAYIHGRMMQGIPPLSVAVVLAEYGLEAFLTVAALAGLVRAYRKKRPQALCASAIVASMFAMFCFFPVQTHFDGVSDAVSARPEGFYIGLAQRLREHATKGGENVVPPRLFEQVPELGVIFPDHANEWERPRFEVNAEYLDVFAGGSLGGTRGFRVYEGSDSDLPSQMKVDAGNLRRIHPKVYAFTRYY